MKHSGKLFVFYSMFYTWAHISTLPSFSVIESYAVVFIIATSMLYAIFVQLKDKQEINAHRDSSLEKAIVTHFLHAIKLDFVCDLLHISRVETKTVAAKRRNLI